MDYELSPETLKLREDLEKQLKLLKVNREKVPLAVLKSKYKKGYDALCCDIKNKTSEYASAIAIRGIRFREDYLYEGVAVLNDVIEKTAMAKEISKAAFIRMDIDEITRLSELVREEIIAAVATRCDTGAVIIGGGNNA